MLSHANIARELLLVLLASYLFASVKAFRSALNPLVVAIAPWLAILAAQEIIAPSMYFSWLAAAIIAGSLLCVGLGAIIVLVCMPNAPLRSELTRLEPVRARRWLRYSVFGAIIGGVSVHAGVTFYYGAILGVGVSSTGSFSAYALFDEVMNSPVAWPYRIATTMVQVGAVICGLELRTKRPAYSVIIFFLAVVTSEGLFIASRLGMFLAYSAVILGWLVFAGRRYRRMSPRLVLSGIVGLFVVAALYQYTSGRRVGTDDDAMNNRMVSGLISSPSVLTGVMKDREGWIVGTLGGESFRGIMLFTTGQDWDSYAQEAYPIAPEMPETSNMVTGLWQILIDFGIAGSAILMTLMGALSTGLFMKFSAQPTAKRAGSLLCVYLLLCWLPIFVITHYMFFWCVMVVALKIDLLYCVAPDAGSDSPSVNRNISQSAESARPCLAHLE